MRRPGTDENDVKMSDVLCDFCHRAWTEDVPMIEGHRGSCICARCLTVASSSIERQSGIGSCCCEPQSGYAANTDPGALVLGCKVWISRDSME